MSGGKYSATFEGEISVLNKSVVFLVVVDGKEYQTQTEPSEVKYQPGAMEQVNIIVDIPADSTSGTGTSGGGASTSQIPAAPTAQPPAGSYDKSVVVSLYLTGGGTIYYTTDQSDPKTSSTADKYTGAITINNDITIKAVSVKNNCYSPVSVFSYKINLVPTVIPPTSLVDIDNHWAAETIREMVYKGIVAGYPDGTFRPENTINRAECAAILSRALGLPAGDTGMLSGFADKDTIPVWAQNAIAAALGEDLIKGYPEAGGNTTFQPLKPITRTELAAILSRTLTQEVTVEEGNSLVFTDQAQIPLWARQAVDIASQADIVAGYPDGSFKPSKVVTRAEATVMVERLLERI
ncbi:MAG: S-layer homology domain-containing protein [Bacillota bacterium]